MAISDYLPDFSDPNNMAVWGSLGGLLKSATPQYGVNKISGGSALAGVLSDIMQGTVGGASAAQQYKSGDLANQNAAVMNPIAQQTAQLGLEKQQVLQPLQLQMMKSAMGGNSAPFGVPQMGQSESGNAGSAMQGVSDQQFAQAYQLAMAGGDMAKASAVLQSWAEHNPSLAGQIKLAQENNTYQKTPQGTYALPSPQSAFGSPVPDAIPQGQGIAPVAASQLQPPPSPDQIPNNPYAAQQGPQSPRDLAAVPPLSAAQQSPPGDSQFLASDGKPFVPMAKQASLLRPDISGVPKYKTENTETGIKQTEAFQKDDVDANKAMTDSISNSNQMLARLGDIGEAYQQAQTGTLPAQHSQIWNELIGAGIIKDPAEIHNVAEYQRAMSDLVTETMNQIKGANAGTSQGRILNSEFQNVIKKMADPDLQPEAAHDIIALSTGFANYNTDQGKGWDAIGGLGNRVAGGFTLRPDDYVRQYQNTHDLKDYIKKAQADVPQFKGQPQSAPNVLQEGTIIRNKKNPSDKKIVKNGQLMPYGGQ